MVWNTTGVHRQRQLHVRPGLQIINSPLWPHLLDYQGQGNFFLTLYTLCDFHHNSYLIIWPLTPQVPVQLPGRGGQLPPQAPVPVWLSGFPSWSSSIPSCCPGYTTSLSNRTSLTSGDLSGLAVCHNCSPVQLSTCSMGSVVKYVVCLISECSLLYL